MLYGLQVTLLAISKEVVILTLMAYEGSVSVVLPLCVVVSVEILILAIALGKKNAIVRFLAAMGLNHLIVALLVLAERYVVSMLSWLVAVFLIKVVGNRLTLTARLGLVVFEEKREEERMQRED